MKSALKASVISSGSLILLLNEREQNIETQKISRTTCAPRTSTPSGNTTTSEDLQSSESSNRTSIVLDNNPEVSSSVDVTLPSETNASSIQNIFSEENLSTMEESDGKITNESVIFEEPTSSVFDLSVKQEMVLSPVILTLQSQLSQVEQDWVEIQTTIPALQQGLHQVHFTPLLTASWMVGNKDLSVSCSSVWSIVSLKENIMYKNVSWRSGSHPGMISCITEKLMKSLRNRVCPF